MHGIVYVTATTGDEDPLEKEVRTLGVLLQQVKDEQEYIKIRERVHRNSTPQSPPSLLSIAPLLSLAFPASHFLQSCCLIGYFLRLMVAAESTNSRVKWWSIFQTGVLIGVCVFQVAYLKRYFG